MRKQAQATTTPHCVPTGVAILATCLAIAAPPAIADEDDIRKAGDILQFALPLGALGATWYYKDLEGAKQFGYSFGYATATQVIGKEMTKKLRPDAGAQTSYPSGHTQAAFSGAAFLNTRYGPAWGIPAYALAVFTGYSRVNADAHFADDVLAGASIGLLWNWAMVEPRGKGPRIAPMAMRDGVGLTVMVSDAPVREGNGGSNYAKTNVPRFRYEYQYSPSYLRKNAIRAPGTGGTEFDMDNFQKTDDPTSASVVRFEWLMAPRHALEVSLTWFEARDFGQFSQPTVFGNSTFPAATQVRSAYRAYDTRFTYRYDLAPGSEWIAQAGAAVAPVFISMELTDDVRYEKVQEWGLVVAPHATVGRKLSRRWHLIGDATGLAVSNDKVLDTGITLRYVYSQNWEYGLGYRRYESRVDSGKLYNDVKYDVYQFSVAHRW